MSIVVTGGSGFIGSCIIRHLNDCGRNDIFVVDNIQSTDKWKNLVNKKFIEYINRDDFLERLPELSGEITHIVHMGACSATTERDFEYLYSNNTKFTQELWKYCAKEKISFIYASSAATYGGGEHGFDDNLDIGMLEPLNGYGYSKHLFDLWAGNQIEKPKQYCGFKFFNVYGPNEYYKGSMASVVFHSYNKIHKTHSMDLFKSYHSEYLNGEQVRDFIYVKDICKVIMYCIEHPEINGLFNLGTGVERSFLDLCKATFNAMGISTEIKFIDMPDDLKDRYQYYTRAEMSKLYDAGYKEPFYTLEEGINDYVNNYLAMNMKTY